MRSAVLLIVLAISSAANAQGSPFRPLQVGNEWTFVAQRDSRSGTQDCVLPALSDYLHLEVRADTTMDGAEARVVGCTQFAPDGNIMERGRMIVPVDFDIPARVISGTSLCVPLGVGAEPVVTEAPSTIDIGGIPYVMSRTARHVVVGTGPGGSGGGKDYRYGDPVGLYSAYSWHTSGWGAPYCSKTRYLLVHAIVNGEVYGANPVAGDTPPVPPSGFALIATPTPTTGTVSLRLAGPARAEVAVYSLTGRRVATGVMVGGELTLETRTWSPGVYVARAVADGQVLTSRIVVVR